MKLVKMIGLMVANLNSSDKACINCTFRPFCVSKNQIPHPSLATVSNQLRKKEALELVSQKILKLYAVRQGALKIFQVDAEGNELIHRFCFAGEVYGFEAISSQHYKASVAALIETQLCEIPYKHFLTLLHYKPELQSYLLTMLSGQLNQGSYLIFPSAEQRFAAFLLDIDSRLQAGQRKQEFNFPMSRDEMGNYLGLSGETVSRFFSRFQKDNIISIHNKNMQILQFDKLSAIAAGC